MWRLSTNRVCGSLDAAIQPRSIASAARGLKHGGKPCSRQRDTASDNIQNAMPDHMPTASTVHVHPPRRPARLGIARRFAGAVRRILPYAFCAIAFTLPALVCGAEQDAQWKAVIAEHPATPPYLIAVDKSRQELAFFERRSPLKLSRRFACTTGQAVGDKILEGDLKTPEGIYFVGYRIGSGLDFIKYGHEAYTLNYPNPVDRLRKKTGYGIWIHGRGEPLVPLQTEGCVSMNNSDLALLNKVLVPGAPVALTGSFVYEPKVGPEDEKTCLLLRDKVEAWARAWSDRSRDYFSFYDKEAYSIAQGEPFSAFQGQKERLFKMLPWIRTTVRDVQVLRGPDYWVTWFYQDYQAPNLSTKGVRRLYWGKNAKGEFRILGMEWHPGLNTSTLLASADPLLPPLEAQGPFWPEELPGLNEKRAVLTAEAPAQSGQASAAIPPAAAQEAPGAGAQTTSQAVGQTTGQATTQPAPADETGPLLAQAAAPKNTRAADHVESPAHGSMARPSPEAVRIGRELNRQARESETSGATSGAASDAAFDAARRADKTAATGPAGGSHPAFNLPPPLPAQGIGSPEQPLVVSAAPVPPVLAAPASGAAAPGKDAAAPEATEPPAPLSQKQPQQESQARVQAQPLEEPRTQAQAAPETPPAEPAPLVDGHKGAEWLGQDAGPAPTPSPAAATATPEFMSAWVEEWRAAWQAGDVDLYMAFYAPSAKQGSRSGAAAIRKHKERIWAGAAPDTVALADVSVSIKGDTATAVMRQTYRDNRGKGDHGRKKLTFRNINGVWLITQEDWSPLPDEAGN